jgi:hypothetical protein
MSLPSGSLTNEARVPVAAGAFRSRTSSPATRTRPAVMCSVIRTFETQLRSRSRARSAGWVRHRSPGDRAAGHRQFRCAPHVERRGRLPITLSSRPQPVNRADLAQLHQDQAWATAVRGVAATLCDASSAVHAASPQICGDAREGVARSQALRARQRDRRPATGSTKPRARHTRSSHTSTASR